MDYFTTMHMMDLYGLNPNNMPFAFQFPRIPPSASSAIFNSSKNYVKKKFGQADELTKTKLGDFQQMYQKYAASLFDLSSPKIIPPGHPLFSRQNSIETIQKERDKLLRENFELKKQLEKFSKQR